MFKLDIKPIHHEGLNCFQDSLISVASWLNRDYEIAFSQSWGFDFVPESPDYDGVIGSRLSPGKDMLIDLISIHCGISLIINTIKDFNEVLFIIQTELSKNLPTLIYIDSFWCPWHSQYQKLHQGHYCLAIGLDNDLNIYCIDPLLTPLVSLLPYNCFINGCGGSATFNISTYSPLINYWDFVGDSLSILSNNKCFQKMLEFGDTFNESFDYALEFKEMEISIWNVLIHRNIGFIAGGRVLYSKFLEYISTKTNNNSLLGFKYILLKAASNWNSIRGVLTKCYYTKYDDQVKNKVVDLIRNAASFEENILNSLFDLIKNSNGISDVTDSEKLLISKEAPSHSNLIFLTLEDYFNNNGIGNINSEKCTADFTGSGCFILSDGFPLNDILSIGDIKFKLPQIEDGQNDNISCEQQEIHFCTDCCTGILFLGAAENGNFFDYIKVVYKDDSVDIIPFMFSDWDKAPSFNEVPVWEGLAAKRRNNIPQIINGYRVRLFAKEYEINKNKIVNKIIMPYCPNIHIFALTLRILE